MDTFTVGKPHREGRPVTVAICKALATIQASDDDSEFGPHGGFRGILSTPSRDRDGDSLRQDEWLTLPDRLPLDVDHGMNVATTIGSFAPYWEDGKMMIEARFSSLPEAQRVRTLIREGHVRGLSVAFRQDKQLKSEGLPFRELLNCGVVAIPSNPDAVILESKAVESASDPLAQAVHDAAIHLGAVCYPLTSDMDDSGAADGANDPADDEKSWSRDLARQIIDLLA